MIPKMSKGLIFTLASGLAIIILFYFLFGMNNESFTVNSLFLKTVLKQGEVSSLSFKITNLAKEESFAIQTRELDNLISLSRKNLSVTNNNEEEIEVTFNATGVKPGIYIGSISVDNGRMIKIIPVVMEVQTPQILYAINLDVGPEYQEIKKGGKTLTGVRFFNLNDTRTHKLQVEYSIRDIDGKSIASVTENVSVGSKYDITKILDMPGDAKSGNYVFTAVLKYGNSVSTSSYVFNVKSFSLPFELNFFSVVLMLFLLAIAAVVIYIFYERGKLFTELRNQHDREIKELITRIDMERNISVKKAKNKEQKKQVITVYKIIRKKAKQKVKEKYKQRIIEVRKLKKLNKKEEMRNKVEKWQRQGYNTEVMFNKIREETKAMMRKQLEKWKRQGYDVSIITK